jgi:hypothetical protein
MKMKKFFLAISMTVIAICAYAQNEVGSVTIQPKVGFNIADVTDANENNPRFGLVAGAEFEYQLSERLGLAVGLVYSAQGDKETRFDNYGNKVKLTEQLDYINFPIMANLYIVKGLAVKLGIQPGLNLKADYEFKSGGVSVSGSFSDLGIDIESFDFSVPVGLSYEYKKFVLDARYNIGLTKLVDGDSSKNSVFQFTLGYKFNL